VFYVGKNEKAGIGGRGGSMGINVAPSGYQGWGKRIHFQRGNEAYLRILEGEGENRGTNLSLNQKETRN